MASYYVWSGATGSANGSSWANAFTTLNSAFGTEAAGDTLYVAHDHSESTTGGTWAASGTTSNLSKCICVNRAGTVPPVAADLRATAVVAITSTNWLQINGSTHFDGIIFNIGTGSSGSANLFIGEIAGTYTRFDNCSFRFPITGAGGGSAWIGGSTSNGGGTVVEFNNTTMSATGANGTDPLIWVNNTFRWRNTPSAIATFGYSKLISINGQRGAAIEFVGVDLSAIGSGKTLIGVDSSQGGSYRFIDCKLNASVTKTATASPGLARLVDFVRSDATGNFGVYRQSFPGTLTQETTIVRTGGATDGTTPISWKVITNTTCFYSMPFECPPIAIWNDTTGSAKTATIEGIWGGGAVPNDDDIWLDLEYLGDAASPQGSFVNDGRANLLTAAAAQTSSSATWGGSTTKFKLNVTFTAQQKGWIYARVKCGKASSTFYIDPLITLT